MLKSFASTLALTAALSGLVGAAPATADEVEMQSVWHEGTSTSLHTGLLSLQDFTDTALEQIGEGLRLVDVETARLNGARGFAGLFTEGTGGNRMRVVEGLPDFRDTMAAERSGDLMLADLEVFRHGPRLRWVGVFLPGRGRQEIVAPLPIARFLERKELNRTRDLQLVDVEPVRVGGELRFVGLYRSDAPPAVFTGFRPRPNLVELRDRMRRDGWELFDLERVVNAQGRDVYVALWRQGPGAGQVSRFRTSAEQLFFSGAQREAGFRAIDFELRVTETGVEPPPDPVEDPMPLPPNPASSGFANESDMRIEFQGADDIPFFMTLPRRWIPDWLPQQDGEYLLPDAPCAMDIRLADSIVWQRPGEPEITEGNLVSVPDLDDTDETAHLGGIRFSGPLGVCTGQSVEWRFSPPFTEGSPAVEPSDNLSLVVEAVNGELRFPTSAAAGARLLRPDELYLNATAATLRDILNAFDAIAEQGGNIDAYCDNVGRYFEEVCAVSPGSASCLLPRPNLPTC
ncbi:MAG: hypothetical protein RID11_00200 [Roseovarius sp.]|uniref:hypothetical protein n=1 Tax=Roseovarius sp. TaxID=1486281 RepID=UPI0032EDC595